MTGVGTARNGSLRSRRSSHSSAWHSASARGGAGEFILRGWRCVGADAGPSGVLWPPELLADAPEASSASEAQQLRGCCEAGQPSDGLLSFCFPTHPPSVVGKGLHGAPVGGFLFKYQLPPTSWGRPASLKTTLLNATRFCSAEARPGKCLSSPAVHMGSGPVGSGSCLLAWVKSGAIRAQPVRSAPLIANAPERGALQGAR